MKKSNKLAPLKEFLDHDGFFAFGGPVTADKPTVSRGKDHRPTLSVVFRAPITEAKPEQPAQIAVETVKFSLLSSGKVRVTSELADPATEFLRDGKPAYTATFKDAAAAVAYFKSDAAEVTMDNDPCRITKTSALALLQAKANVEFEHALDMMD